MTRLAQFDRMVTHVQRDVARLFVEPVTVEVSQGDPALVVRLLDPRPITAAEWAVIEGGVK